jgi:uncharacterized protein
MSENVDLVRSAYEAFGKGDIPGLIALLGDRVEWDSTSILPQGGSWRGRDGAGEFFQGVGRAWEELRVEPEELIDGGEHVVVTGRAAGRLSASGTAAGYGFVQVFTVSDGQVVRFREWADPDEELREQLR